MLREDKRWASNSGMGMVEILMASALMAFVALGIATITTNFQNSSNGVKFRLDADTLNEEMRSLLSSQDACAASFTNLDVSADNKIPLVKDGLTPTQTTYQTGKVYGDRSVQIADLHLKDFVPGSAPNTGQMTLYANLKTQRTAMGSQNLIRTIRVGVNVATGKVASCIALAKMTDGIWQRTAADVNNIMFNVPAGGVPQNGFVAIGTDTPKAMLDVANDVRVTTTGHRLMPISLIPNTEGNPGVFWQGIGFNFEYQRFMNEWHTGGDGANGGGAAIFFDHGPSNAMSFYNLPNQQWVFDRKWTTKQVQDSESFRITGNGAMAIKTLATNDNQGAAGLASRLSTAGLNGAAYHFIGSDGSGGNQTYFGEYGGGFHFVDTNLSRDVVQIQNARLGVGIGFNNLINPTETLHVRGRARIEQLSAGTATPVCIDAGNVLSVCSSVRRFKQNVRPLDLGLDEVLRLKPSLYAWKGNGDVDLGFVAEEVAEISPVLTTRDRDGNLIGVKYAQLTALLTRAFQQLVGRQADRDDEVAELKARIEALEKRLDQLGSR